MSGLSAEFPLRGSGIRLKVDHRENKLKPWIEKRSDWTIEYENLPHGDFQFWIHDQVRFVMERKSLSDLTASIKDGRYKNQKMVLLQSGYSPSQLYYIIEGTWKRWSDSTGDSSMQKGAVINTLLRDKMGIFTTKSEEDTVDLLYEIYTRIVKQPSQYIEDIEPVRQVTVMTQQDKITPSICFRNMLCQIPGISQVTAEGLCKEFGTLKQMMIDLNELDAKEKKDRLESIRINKRKISSKVVQGILKYICSED
jgi:ERCC4-type nuclease